MKVLFITRKYPPAIGGMENYLYDLITNYKHSKEVITYGGKQKYLPLVYLYFFLKALWLIKRQPEISHIHLGDGVLAPLGIALNKLTKRKLVITVYGKDLIFDNFIYQKFVVPFIRKIRTVVAISKCTQNDAISVGIPSVALEVIPCGISPSKYSFPHPTEARQRISDRFNLSLSGKKVLVTVGRLSERKGQLWFTENVVPHLPSNYLYLIAGPDASEIKGLSSLFGIKKVTYSERLKKIIKEKNLSEKVFYLGKITQTDLTALQAAANLSIMPNLHCPGDREGFGIVNIESGLAGTPVIAANIDGIPDSILVHIAGELVTSKDVNAYVQAIIKWIDQKENNQERIKEAVSNYYNWSRIIDRYEKVFINAK